MRVLFTTWAIQGHFNSMVPLGWALRAAGHEVLVAAHPSFGPTITRAGLPALPTGPEVDIFAVLREKRLGHQWRQWDPDVEFGTEPEEPFELIRGQAGLRETATGVAEALADDLVSFARTWQPDLVVFEPTSFVGPLVAKLLGVPAVRHLWTTDFTASANGFDPILTGALPERFGLDHVDCAGDLTLDPCPPRLQLDDGMPRTRIRYIPYNGPAVLPEWLREAPSAPRVCLSWGSSLGGLGLDRMAHVPRVLDAVTGFDVEVVVAVGTAQRELFADAPANVRSVGPVPLSLLLPTCSALVQPGGAGTTMTALACGLPQLIVPSVPDQLFTATRLATTGAGRYVEQDQADVDTVREAFGAVLNEPSYRDNARALQADMFDQPTPAQIVGVLEGLALEATVAPV